MRHCGSRTVWRNYKQSGVAEGNIVKTLPSTAWLRRRNFTRYFPQSGVAEAKTLWRHSLLSGVAEEDVPEDITHNSGIAELLEDIPFWAELRKKKFLKTLPITAELRNFLKTFSSDQSCVSGTSPWHYPQSEMWKQNFMKIFPSTAKLRIFVKTFPSDLKLRKQNFDMTLLPRAELRKRNFLKTCLITAFPSERSCERGTSPWPYPQSRVAETKLCKGIPPKAELGKRTCEDICPRVELRERNFKKTYPREELRKHDFGKTFP